MTARSLGQEPVTGRVLVTGFEPFGGDDHNPSWDAVRLLADRGIDGVDLHIRRLPVVYGEAGDALVAAIEEVRPLAVIATGLAGGPAHLRLERVALNVDDARIPDNAGATPVDAPVVEDGPTAYLSSLPIKAALAALRDAGIPAVVSNTAGTFVCNHVAYRLAHHLARGGGPSSVELRGGFVHVPPSGEAGLATPLVADALALVVRTCLERPTSAGDLRLAAGALD